MSFLKYALPFLALGGTVFADDHCGSGDTIEIQNQGDANSYGSCQTLKGDVKISHKATNIITLNGVQQITGSLTCDNATTLSTLAAPELNSIGDDFMLTSLTRLTSLQMNSLTSVGAIQWSALPQLQSLDFASSISKAGSVHIANTGLTDLQGISLSTVGDLIITDNRYLTKVNVDGLTNATGLINFAGNDNRLSVEFPKLISGSNMTFRNISDISVPVLANLTGRLGFWGDSFEKFVAPNLTKSMDLTFLGNDQVKNISMPALKQINGGFLVARNDKLRTLNFPDLERVTGAIDFSGQFNKVVLSSLKDVKGRFNMQSTGKINCDKFQDLKKNKVVKGTFHCQSKDPNPTTADGSSGTSSGGGKSSTTTGSSAASPDNVINMSGMGLAAIFGALVQYAM